MCGHLEGRVQMNQRNSGGLEMAYKTLTIIKWKAAGHGAMNLEKAGNQTELM